MKRMTVAAMAVALGLAVAARAQDAERMKLAEDLLTQLKMKENIERSFSMIKNMLPAQMASASQGIGKTNEAQAASAQAVQIIDSLSKELSWDSFKDDYIKLYAETFTADELKGIIEFYKSPAGMKFIEKQPELMKRSMELSQKMMQKIMPRIQEMTREAQAGGAPAGARPLTPMPAPAPAVEKAPADK